MRYSAGRCAHPSAISTFCDCSPPCTCILSSLALGNDCGLDVAGALHQVIEDAVQLHQRRVACDVVAGIKLAAAQQIKCPAAGGGSVVEGGSQRDGGIVQTGG